MRICFLESRSTRTPWHECHSSLEKGSYKSRSGIEPTGSHLARQRVAPHSCWHTRKGVAIMYTSKQRLFMGGVLTVLALAALPDGEGSQPEARATDRPDVEDTC